MNYFILTAKISRDQSKVFYAGGRLIVPIFHPAAALRSTQVLEQFKESFKKLTMIVNKADEILAKAQVKQEKLF